MTKTSILFSTVLAAAMAVPLTAAAQSSPAGSSCPPGSWFCAEPPQEHPAPTGKLVQGMQPLPDPDAAAPVGPANGRSEEDDTDQAPAPPPRHRRHHPAPPPVVVYEPPPPAVVVREEAPPPYEYPPPRPVMISRPHEWGLNLHLEGAAIGHGAGNAGMGGGGLGVRFKPSRRFGIETDLDIAGGTDWQNDKRTETAFTFNGLLFLNPRSRAQVYLLAGFGWSGAHVTCPSGNCNGVAGPVDARYTYFGGQLGAGLELRLARAIALDADVRGFLRGRVDGQAQAQPEFVDQNGRATNTSAGALFTGGMTIYF